MKVLVVSVLLCAMMALTAAEGTMTSPWVRIDSRYFAYVGETMDWHSAEKNCQLLGGHLASMHGLYERNSIKNLINKYASYSNPDSWLGGNDLKQAGTWEWTNGRPFDYNNWCWDEPNLDGGCIFFNAGRRCYEDLWCSYLSPSVCVKDQLY